MAPFFISATINKYRLGNEERELLLPKMEEYCQQRWGQSLEECCADYEEEQQQSSQQYLDSKLKPAAAPKSRPKHPAPKAATSKPDTTNTEVTQQ